MRRICEREWYTNHGPLAVEAEQRLAAFLRVEEVVCVSNATVALMMAIKALELGGAIIVPALTAPATVEALLWAERVRDSVTSNRTGSTRRRTACDTCWKDDVQAHSGRQSGDVTDVTGLEEVARDAGIPLFFDSAHAFGCAVGGRQVGGSGARGVLPSMHRTC